LKKMSLTWLLKVLNCDILGADCVAK
jgi:hypothetical protein